jgi:hypothetical protein
MFDSRSKGNKSCRTPTGPATPKTKYQKQIMPLSVPHSSTKITDKVQHEKIGFTNI